MLAAVPLQALFSRNATQSYPPAYGRPMAGDTNPATQETPPAVSSSRSFIRQSPFPKGAAPVFHLLTFSAVTSWHW